MAAGRRSYTPCRCYRRPRSCGSRQEENSTVGASLLLASLPQRVLPHNATRLAVPSFPTQLRHDCAALGLCSTRGRACAGETATSSLTCCATVAGSLAVHRRTLRQHTPLPATRLPLR